MTKSKKTPAKILKQITSILLIFTLIFTSLPTDAFKVSAADTAAPIADSATSNGKKATEPYIIAEDTSRRTKNEKHFIMSDGTKVAAMYNTDVHYQDANGKYQDIDNTLLATDDEYETSKGLIKTKLAKKASEKKIVSVTKENYKISWGFQDISKTEVEIKANNNSEKDKTKLKNLIGEALYPNAFEDTDIQYIIAPSVVKENILLKSNSAPNEFTINYDIGKLTAFQKDSKTVELLEGNKVIYTISAPNMVDSEGAISDKVSIKIASFKKGKMKLQLSADKEWLNATDRAYPVTVDPAIEVNQSSSTLVCKTTYEADSPTLAQVQQLNSYKDRTFLGWHEAYGEMESIYYFNSLPTLAKGDYITNAMFSLATNGSLESPINLYELDEYAWCAESTPAINYQPWYNEDVIDYLKASETNFTFDITNLIRKWYQYGIPHQNVNGFMLKADTRNVDYLSLASSSNSTVQNRPSLFVYYINQTGIESYLSYTDVNIGIGTGYINNATGNLTLDIPITATKGQNMPAGVNLYYNGTDIGKQTKNLCGSGWRLNADQRIDAVTNQALKAQGYDYTYTDIDGTVNYMKKKGGTTDTYEDEIGAGLTLKIQSNQKILSDKGNNESYFDTTGKLIKQKSGTSSSEITYSYNSGGYLQRITDGAGDEITFERNSNNVITNIVDAYGRKNKLEYTSNKLTKITAFDGAVTSLNYDSEGYVKLVTLPTGSQVEFMYWESPSDLWRLRVSAVTEYSMPNEDGIRKNGNSLYFNYTYQGSTDVSDNNVNDICYSFDSLGRAISVYGDTGAASNAYKQGVENNLTNLNNKIERTTATAIPVENLAKNSNYDNGNSWSTWTDNSGLSGSGITSVTSMLGNTSVKLYAQDNKSVTYYQSYIPKKSGYYTYSVYYKTDGISYVTNAYEGGISIHLALIHKDNKKEYVRSTIVKESTGGGWERLSVTADVDLSDIKEIHLINSLHFAVGSVYFDCAQLEYSETANQYIMLYNGGFSEGTNGWDFFEFANDGVKNIEGLVLSEHTPVKYEKGLYLEGVYYSDSEIGQTVSINKPASEVALNFSAYAFARGCKLPQNNELYNYALRLTFNYSDNTTETITRSFDVRNWDWQLKTELIMPSPENKNKTVTTAKAEFIYNRQENFSVVTGLQLTVDTTGKIYIYDDKGNPISAVDTKENAVSSQYDDKDRLTQKTMEDGSQYTFNYNSSVNERLVSSSTAPKDQKTEYTYNSYSQITSTTVSNSVQCELPKMISSTVYTDNGKLVYSQTDTMGNTVTNEYDSYDRISRINNDSSNPNNYITYNYDNADRVTSASQKQSENGANSTVGYTYDNYMLSSVSHNGFDYSFVYDEFGNKTQTKIGDRVLNTNDYTYRGEDYNPDNDGYYDTSKLIKSTYGNDDYVEYDYDWYGRIVGKKVNGALKVSYVYNEAGNIGTLKDLENNVTYTYDYDTLGRPYTISGSNGFRVKYSYDGSNRVTGTYYSYSGEASSTTNIYEIGGFLKSSTFSGGATVEYGYDYLARVGNKTTKPNSASSGWVTSYGYLNPTADTTTQMVNSINHQAINLNLTYTYDNLGNVTEIKENGVLKASYVYDNLNQLVRENNAYTNKTVTYSYDGGGNILTKTEYPFSLSALDENSGNVVSYSYTDSQWKDLLTAYNGSAITYDAIGNPLSYYNGISFTWQNGRQLESATLTDGKVIAYKYNSEGIRTSKTVNGIKTDYLLDGSSIVREQTGNQVMWFSYDGAGTLTSVNYNGVSYYYYHNLQGDVIGIYDQNLNKVVGYSYDAWGKLISITGSMADTLGIANPFRYRGYYYDTELGLYYLNSRYYDPKVGRFINADGYASTGQDAIGCNMFAYCGNNPVIREDPTGKIWSLVLTAISLAVIGTMIAAVAKKVISKKAPAKKPTQSSSSNSTLTNEQKKTQLIVAQTIYGEEHGRTVYKDWKKGQQAVATVILNRQKAQISYLGKDLNTICTNGQFDGYFAGKRDYEAGVCDLVAWDSAMALAEDVVLGSLKAPSGMSTNHLYFNATGTFNKNVSRNGGRFSFGSGTTLVSPKGVINYGGNTFFYY